MRYSCLIYTEADKLDAAPANECLAHAAALRKQGRCHGAEALDCGAEIGAVRLRDGKLDVTDGPFAESKEVLGGFYVIEAANREDAILIASTITPLKVGRAELRPILDVAGYAGMDAGSAPR